MPRNIRMRRELPAHDQLRRNTVYALPVDRARGWDDNDEDEFGANWAYYELYEIDGVTMVSECNTAHALLHTHTDGTTVAYESDDYADYAAEILDDDEADSPMTEGAWDDLFGKHEPAYSGAEGPMMNYWYPLPAVEDDPVQSAADLADLPLCVVRVEDEWGIALTGGGEDLTWEIVEAYLRLGQLPPRHFADLPGQADRPRAYEPARTVDARIVQACLETFAHVEQAAKRDADQLSARYRSLIIEQGV